MPAGAACASARSAKIGIAVHAQVSVVPRDLEPVADLLGVFGAYHLRRQRVELGARATDAAPAKQLERVDAAVIVGPRDTECVAADDVDVLRHVRIRLS